MVVIAGDSEDTRSGAQAAELPTKGQQVTAHRFAPGEIIAGKENESRLLAVNQVNRLPEALQILFAIDMKIADLAGYHSF